jgi:hypothetical protein
MTRVTPSQAWRLRRFAKLSRPLVVSAARQYWTDRRHGKGEARAWLITTTRASSLRTNAQVTGHESRPTALILAREVLGAGLLGALVEAAGATPRFALDGERPELAVARVRPNVVLVDAYHPAARADAFFQAARSARTHVVVFAPSEPWKEMCETATRWNVAIIYPRDGESLAQLIRAAIGDLPSAL